MASQFYGSNVKKEPETLRGQSEDSCRLKKWLSIVRDSMEFLQYLLQGNFCIWVVHVFQ